MILDGSLCNSTQSLMEFLIAPFLVAHFSYYIYINDLPDIIRSIAIDVDDTTLYSKSDQVSVLRQQLKLAFELLSDQQDIVNWGRKTAC